MKNQVSIFALALASSVLAQVSEMSDGQPTESPATSYVVTTAPPPETTPLETSGLSYGPYTITEADHTETVTLPIPPIPTSGWTTTVITVAGATETIPLPIGPTAPYEISPPATPPAPYTGTSAYIPPNPPVPSTGFTSIVISEAGATETVPIPQTPTAPAVTTPVETTPIETTPAPETTTAVPYIAAAAFQTPMMGMLAGALGVVAAL